MNKQEYKRKNEQWLEEKAKEEGVNELPRGILYKVLKSGDPNGKTPNLSNVIVAHYTGRTINGKQFDNSYSGAPLAIRLRELIEGWIIALQRMHAGDKWEPISQPKWATESSPNQASPPTPPSSSKSNSSVSLDSKFAQQE